MQLIQVEIVGNFLTIFSFKQFMLIAMDYPEYRELTKQIPIGKQLPDSVYVHESGFGQIPEKLAVLALETIDQYKIRNNSWNIIKFFNKTGDSLLNFDISKLSRRRNRETGTRENGADLIMTRLD